MSAKQRSKLPILPTVDITKKIVKSQRCNFNTWNWKVMSKILSKHLLFKNNAQMKQSWNHDDNLISINRLHDPICHIVRFERWQKPRLHIIKHPRRLHKIRTNNRRLHPRHPHLLQLHPERLVETERRMLRCAIVHQLADADEAGHRGNRHYVTPIILNHMGEERFGRPEGGHDVHVKGALNQVVGGVQEESAGDNASVVDQNCDLGIWKLMKVFILSLNLRLRLHRVFFSLFYTRLLYRRGRICSHRHCHRHLRPIL